MNILLTDKCSNNCPYCFAREKLEENSKLNEMPLENYRKVLDFLKRSENSTVKLLGGEPMIHSNISEIIDITVKDDDFSFITVFTGGIFSTDLVSLLAREKINIVLNTNHPSDYKEGKREFFIKNLDFIVSLGLDVTLGYNIYKTDFDQSFIIELLDYYKIKKLRWAVAVPTGSGKNLYVPFEDYQKMGKRLTEFLLKIAPMGVEAIPDCFVPFCTFDDSDYGKLTKAFPAMARDCLCEPAVDVGPDLTVWRCFALSGYENINLEKFSNLEELNNFFISSFDHYKWHIWPEKCSLCRYRISKTCQTSCLAFKLKEIKNFLKQEKESLSILEETKGLYAKNDVDSAYIKYKEALSIAPYSLKILKIKTDSALFHIKSGNLSIAKDILHEVELKYSGSPAVYIYSGLICEEEKDYEGAIKNYVNALKFCRKDENVKEKIKKLRSLQIIKLFG